MAWKQVQRQQQQAQAQTSAQPEASTQPEQSAQSAQLGQDIQNATGEQPADVISPLVIPDLDALLSAATPEQLAKIRALAAGKGITAASPSSTRLPDGSMMVSVRLDAPVAEQLEIWAEADGLSLVDEAQKRIVEALENYLYGDWNPTPVPDPVVVAAK
jgi:hypothetical protein